MDVSTVIQDALIKYDKTVRVIKYLLTYCKVTYKQSGLETKRSTLTFTNASDDKDIVLETEIELMGIFYDKYNVWSWGWVQPGILKPEIYLVKEILIHALDMELELSDIRQLLVSPRAVFSDKMQLDICLAIAGSVIKHCHIFPYKVTEIDGKYKLFNYYAMLNEDGLDKLRKRIEQEDRDKTKIDEIKANEVVS